MKKNEQSPMELQLTQSTEELILLATEDLLSSTIQSDQEFNEMLETFKGFFIDGIDDMVSYKAVKDGAKKLKDLRILIDKHRKSLTAPATKWQKDLKAVADNYMDKISPMEAQLNEQLKVVDDKKKAAEEALFSERAQKLAEAGYQLAGSIYVMGVLQVPVGSIIKMADDELQFFIDEAKKAQERKSAADKEYQDKMDALLKKEQDLAEREARLNKSEETAKPVPAEKPHEMHEDMAPEPAEFDENGISNVDFEEDDSPAAAEGSSDDEAPQYTNSREKAIDGAYHMGYREGFANMQMRMVEYLSGDKKVPRAQVLNWISDQQPNLD